MASKDESTVQHELTRFGGGGTPQELVFDPRSGELVVMRPGEARPNPDAMTLNQIAEDGFFAGRP